MAEMESASNSTNQLNKSLFEAVCQYSVDTVRSLIEQGADKDAVNDDGDRPLHVPIKNGQLKIIKLLLEMGADVDAPDKSGKTPLHLKWPFGVG